MKYLNLLIIILFFIPSLSLASGFQLREENGAGVGDYHAGGAAEAQDASTEFYNPAGLVRIQHPQLVLGGVVVVTDIPVKGTIEVSTVNLGSPQRARDQVGGTAFIPNAHVAIPITNNLVIGFGMNTPFGLQTDYSKDTFFRYGATHTSVKTINIGPSIAYRINRFLAVGVGFDAQYIKGNFEQVAGLGSLLDTDSINEGSSWGYGYHLGFLILASPSTRVGVSYRSQVVQHLRGRSKFRGLLANGLMGGIQTSDRLKASITLPPTTILSLYHDFNKQWTVLFSVDYVQWDTIKDLILRNVAALDTNTFMPDNNTTITIHENYRNTWNIALGAHFKPNEKLTLKSGIGFDQTPVRDNFRTLQLPDSNRFVIALGAHYQVLKCLGVDLGWLHIFSKSVPITNTQDVAGELVTPDARSRPQADVVGFQLTWNIT